jgi:hypothetical protein
MFMTEEHNRGMYPEKYKPAVTSGPTNISYIPHACDTRNIRPSLRSSRNINPLCFSRNLEEHKSLMFFGVQPYVSSGFFEEHKLYVLQFIEQHN